jgi:hypothetical protein
MNKAYIISLLLTALSTGCASAQIPNRLIDFAQFQELVKVNGESRESRRLTEKQFLHAIESGEYILLDARSEKNYQLRHIKSAINLPLTEFTSETLAKIIPSQDAKILIYCNNNFLSSPVSFASKAPAASLNLSTQVSLNAYGYFNIYELGPLLDINKTILPFEGIETQ